MCARSLRAQRGGELTEAIFTVAFFDHLVTTDGVKKGRRRYLDVRFRPKADIHNGLLTLPLGSLVVCPTLTPALERYDNVKRRDIVHRLMLRF